MDVMSDESDCELEPGPGPAKDVGQAELQQLVELFNNLRCFNNIYLNNRIMDRELQHTDLWEGNMARAEVSETEPLGV